MRPLRGNHPPTDASQEPHFRALAAGEGLALAFHAPQVRPTLGLASAGEGAVTMLTFDPGSVEGFERIVSDLVAAGVRVIRDPFDTEYGSRQAVFADPAGAPFRINTFLTSNGQS